LYITVSNFTAVAVMNTVTFLTARFMDKCNNTVNVT